MKVSSKRGKNSLALRKQEGNGSLSKLLQGDLVLFFFFFSFQRPELNNLEHLCPCLSQVCHVEHTSCFSLLPSRNQAGESAKCQYFQKAATIILSWQEQKKEIRVVFPETKQVTAVSIHKVMRNTATLSGMQ